MLVGWRTFPVYLLLKLLHKFLAFLSSLTCTATLPPVIILPYPLSSPFVLLLIPLSVSHAPPLACSLGFTSLHQANRVVAPELGSMNWDCFQRPVFK